MSERDRKQIVAEVCVNCRHSNSTETNNRVPATSWKTSITTNMVRYHDRYVDSDAGILCTIME